MLGQAGNGLGIAAHANAADDADQEAALDLVEGVAQGGVHGRVGDRLQAVAGHVREFFVAEEGGQRSHGFRVPTRPSSRQASALALRGASDLRTAINLASSSLGDAWGFCP